MNDGTKSPVAEFSRRVLIAVGVVAVAVAATAAFVRASDVFFLFFAAILMAILLRSIADALDKKVKLGPNWSLVIVFVAITLLLGATVYAVGATAVAQFNHLAADLPKSVEQARNQLRQYSWGTTAMSRMPAVEDLIVGKSDTAASTAARFFSMTFGVLGNLLVFTALSIYLAASPQLYVSGTLKLVPRSRRARASEILGTIGAQLKWWMVGRLLAMVVVGVIVGIGLFLIGVPQYLVLALVAASLTSIPFFGAIVAAIPGILLALMQGPDVALWAIGVYTLSQLVENNVLTPLVQQRMVRLPPALTIAAVTLVGALFGIMGLLVATPLLVAAKVAVKMLYVEDVIGEDLHVRGEDGSAN